MTKKKSASASFFAGQKVGSSEYKREYKKLIEEMKQADLTKAFEDPLPLTERKSERIGGFVGTVKSPTSSIKSARTSVKSPTASIASASPKKKIKAKKAAQVADVHTQLFGDNLKQDTETFCKIIQDNFMSVKANMEKEFKEKEVIALAAQNKQLKNMENHVEELKEMNATTLEETKRITTVVFNFANYAYGVKHYEKYFWKNGYSARNCFIGWKREQKYQKLKKYRIVRAQRHNERRLSRFVLRRWKTNASSCSRARSEKAFAQKLEEVTNKIITQYEAELEKVRMDLRVATLEVEESRRQCATLEEDMRRVFLKGVSAMNLEALNVFQNRSSSSGYTRMASSASSIDAASMAATIAPEQAEVSLFADDAPRTRVPTPIKHP